MIARSINYQLDVEQRSYVPLRYALRHMLQLLDEHGTAAAISQALLAQAGPNPGRDANALALLDSYRDLLTVTLTYWSNVVRADMKQAALARQGGGQ